MADQMRGIALEVAVESLLDLIADLVDLPPCRCDHRGYCLAHGPATVTETECPRARARRIVAKRRPASGEEASGNG